METGATRPAQGWTAAAAALLGIAGFVQLGYGAAALVRTSSLEAHVQEIQSNPNFGHLYFSLPVWGVLLILIAGAELWSAWALFRRSPLGRLVGLAASLFGLAVAFFTLALFHGAALVPLLLLFAALYVLSYRVT